MLELHPEANRLLLVIDQFEELFTLCAEPAMRQRFVDELLAAAQPGQDGLPSGCALLLTLRADFMGQALAHRPLADALQAGALMLGPMTHAELRAAVEKPAELQGAAFEPGLVDRILENVGAGAGRATAAGVCPDPVVGAARRRLADPRRLRGDRAGGGSAGPVCRAGVR